MNTLASRPTIMSYDKNLFQKPLVSFTFDTDNCPDFAVEFVMELLDSYDIPGTFFCDRRYDNIPSPHETALHPVLQSLRTMEEIITPVREIHKLIPKAVGCRCHQLACNGNIYNALPEMGILYESSWPMALRPNIQPIPMPSGLLQFPIFFAEGMYFVWNIQPSLPQSLQSSGLKVLCFHPVSLFHNLGPDNYKKLRATPPDKRYRKELISKDENGILHLFKKLMMSAKRHSIECKTLSEIASQITEAESTPKNNPTPGEPHQ